MRSYKRKYSVNLNINLMHAKPTSRQNSEHLVKKKYMNNAQKGLDMYNTDKIVILITVLSRGLSDCVLF